MNIVYSSLSSLNSIRKLLNEAAEALSDPSRNEFSNEVSEAIGGLTGGALGVGIGVGSVVVGSAAGTTGAAALSSGLAVLGSLFGGGMIAGIAVAATPAAILAGSGVWVVARRNATKLRQEKETLIKQIVAKQASIQAALRAKVDQQLERLKYLETLLAAFNRVRRDLESDLRA